MWLFSVERWWTATEVLCALIVEGGGYYNGFHVFCDPGVPCVPSNGFTINREQLCENNQHVLEHHKFDVSQSLASVKCSVA